MSDAIKHECGIGLVRLLKPLSYYYKKYDNALWGMNKLYLLMEKQHNRGQDGAGMAAVKIDHPAGSPYLHRVRSIEHEPLKKIYQEIIEELKHILKDNPEAINDELFLRKKFSFAADIYMGHLRYGTHGENSINTCHPFERKNNWKTKNILVSGNFNLTNVEEIMDMLIDAGQHPKDNKDTITVLENIGYHLDDENDRIYHKYRNEKEKKEISKLIADEMQILDVLKHAAKKWDGGYVIQGILGHGESFVMRDPNGIRPAYYYIDDEVIVVASEKAAIATVFNIDIKNIKELPHAHVLIIKKDGSYTLSKFIDEKEKTACTFERIYFSRGSDNDIYRERKELGRLLIPQVLDAVGRDIKNTVFSYIPNTAEISFMGMIEGIEEHLKKYKIKEILKLQENNNISEKAITEILSLRPRVEKAAIKDIKLRTFIADDAHRDEMVAHVYDTTHKILNENIDNLVVIDDSIVRGTTLKESIIRILARLKPKKIVIVSSAPQIRYPDCYGIDMSNLNTLIAFRAAIEILKRNNNDDLIDKVYEECVDLLASAKAITTNPVNKIFSNLSDSQISKEIANLVRPDDLNIDLEIVYQSNENLLKACKGFTGDWYFSGNFPTAGGNKIACKAFVNYYEGKNIRAY